MELARRFGDEGLEEELVVEEKEPAGRLGVEDLVVVKGLLTWSACGIEDDRYEVIR